MKYRLVLLEPVCNTDGFGEETPGCNTDGFGEETPGYKEFRTVAAERVKTSGSRSEEVGEHFPDYRAEFNIRDAHPVKENWRVRQLGGYEYTVTNIIPNIDRGMKTLVCERVNK